MSAPDATPLFDLRPYIRAGDGVIWSQAIGEPRSLTESLVAQRHEFGGIRAFLGAAYTDTIKAEHADAIRFTALGGLARTSALTRVGVVDVIPAHLHAMPQLIATGRIKVDVVLLQVSSPDASGRHSLGMVSDYQRAALAVARVVIAEVNPNVPFTFGDTLVDPERFDAVAYDDRPVVSVPERAGSAAEDAVAEHVAALIVDGTTIQMGIGGVADGVLRRLTDRRHLGVHSGMISDEIAALVEAGVITNERKAVDPGVTVTGLLMGTERLNRWAHRNPALSMQQVSYTHDAGVLAALGPFVALNSAIEVDLTGQVNSERVGGQHIGAIGGLGAFARAASSAAEGRSVIALTSTARGGEVSRIVGRLADGVVTLARADADVVATEHGVAYLRGATLAERAKRMIAIADPRHRDELERAAADL